MSRADTLKKIADHHFGLAELYSELAEASAVVTEQPGQATGVPVSAQPAPVDDLPPMEGWSEPAKEPDRVEPQGSLAMCPKHKKPYTEGQYGPYCSSTTDDPAWANAKGYCTIKPKNVAVWLRAQAA